MGFLEDRRRERRTREAASVNWRLIANMLLLSYEEDLAEKEGLDEPEVQYRAFAIKDTILEKLGNDRIVGGFEAAYVEVGRDNNKLLRVALEMSGYEAARRVLFPGFYDESLPTPSFLTWSDATCRRRYEDGREAVGFLRNGTGPSSWREGGRMAVASALTCVSRASDRDWINDFVLWLIDANHIPDHAMIEAYDSTNPDEPESARVAIRQLVEVYGGPSMPEGALG